MKLISIISRYAGYFHDGSIRNIERDKNGFVISMESAQILPEWEWNKKMIQLSKHETIAGKLHLNEISMILINEKENCKLEMIYDRGSIFDLEIDKKGVKIEVIWKQYIPIKQETGVVQIEVTAKDIAWENIPNLFDQHWEAE